MSEDPKRVGGWLTVWVLLHALILLGAVIAVVSAPFLDWPSALYLVSELLWIGSVAAYLAYTLYNVLLVRPGAVFLARAFYIVQLPFHFIYVFFYSEGVIAALVTVLWLLYWFNSRRVESTWPVDDRRVTPWDVVAVVAFIASLVVSELIGFVLLMQ